MASRKKARKEKENKRNKKTSKVRKVITFKIKRGIYKE